MVAEKRFVLSVIKEAYPFFDPDDLGDRHKLYKIVYFVQKAIGRTIFSDFEPTPFRGAWSEKLSSIVNSITPDDLVSEPEPLPDRAVEVIRRLRPLSGEELEILYWVDYHKSNGIGKGDIIQALYEFKPIWDKRDIKKMVSLYNELFEDNL